MIEEKVSYIGLQTVFPKWKYRRWEEHKDAVERQKDF